MFNLLVVSDSHRVRNVTNSLQPFIRAIIDVAVDYDHCLKIVFEKHPVAVFIQDQIGGVTGESVARHIQMLLGDSAPKFLLLHTGSGKFRAIMGLYEHIVDLSSPDEAVVEDMLNALKATLGSQWSKIFIPPVDVRLDNKPEKPRNQVIAEPVMLALPEIAAVAPPPPIKTPLQPDIPPPLPASPPSVAEFRINRGTDSAEEPIPEDLLLAFEKNYRSKSRAVLYVLIFVGICVVVGGWFIASQQNQTATSIWKSISSLAGSRQAVTPTPVTVPGVVPMPGKPVAPVVPVAQPLPSFIPANGFDASYGKKNVGWERYVDKSTEFRLFRSSGRIMAVQVIALRNGSVPDLLVKAVLKEYTGSQEYQVSSREVKSGFSVVDARVADIAHIKFYKNKSALKAFVVSVK